MRRIVGFVLGLTGLLAAGVALPSVAHAAPHAFRATVSGANENPPTASPATGTVVVTVDDGSNTVCAYLDLDNIALTDITAMHVHTGAAGVNGPVVVPFSPVGRSVCTGGVDPAVVAAIIADPGRYYFNFHTAADPGGAARGQLAAVAPAAQVALSGRLSSAAEVPPNPTPTTGLVGVLVDPSTDLVCVAYSLQNQTLANITAMHIHRAPAGTSGPVVVPFTVDSAACTLADPAIVAALISTPNEFYFNVHTAAYPGGEARAQLAPVGTAATPAQQAVEPAAAPTTAPAAAEAQPTDAVAAEAVAATPRFTG